MVTNFVLSASIILSFEKKRKIDRSMAVRWSPGDFNLLDCPICRWGEPSSDCLACMLWIWDFVTYHSFLFPNEDA